MSMEFAVHRAVCALVLASLPLLAAAQGAGAKPADRKPVARAAARAASAPSAPANKPGFSFEIGAPPAWVQPVEPATGAPSEAAPVYYRVLDEQVRVEGASKTEFTRVFKVIRDAAGLVAASQIEIEFDPAYQTLVLHRLEVLRQGQRINKLDRQRVQLLQREKNLEQRMVDGRVTASIVLDDMRVGDELDLSYSVAGANPVFGGKFVHTTWMSTDRGPVLLASMRLLAPAEREIRVMQGPADATVQTRVEAGRRETVYTRRNVAAVRGEPGAPAVAYLPEQLQFSEFADWAEVAAWGDRLFRPVAAPRVQQKAEQIRAAAAGRLEQVTEALRFVQEEVRYFGVEIGASSHQPSPPDQVLEQRYGDCKDKVALLAALLRQLEVPVRPVLVSTRLRDGVAQVLPGPLAFDHVVASVEVDGKSYLLDPTRNLQSGTLAAREPVGLGQGLELAPGVAALKALPAAYDAERMLVEDRFRITRFAADPVLESRITYRGDMAELMRDAVATRGLQSVVDGVSTAYVRVYPKIRSTATARVEPPGADNSFTLVQQFEVPEFWRFPEQRLLVADIVEWGPVEWVLPPKSETRRLALAFPFPGVYRHRVRVEFPEDVFSQPLTRRVDDGDAHFTLQAQVDAGRSQIEYSAEVRVIADRVEPQNWAAFSAKAGQAMAKLSWITAAPVVPLARVEGLGAEVKTLEDALRRQQIKTVTGTQVQAHFKLKLLRAQIDSGRLAPRLQAQALVARGIAYDNLGRRDEGRQDFEAALALDPESLGALNAAAVNAQSRGQYDAAVDYASRVLRQQPRDAEALHTRALAHYFAGRMPQARADWDAALNDRAALRRGYPLLWQALATRRAGDDLAPLLQKYPRERWPTEWPRPVLDALLGSSTPEVVMVAARSTKTPLESQSEALFYLGEKLAIEGDASKAREQWRKVIDLGVVEFVENSAARLRLAEAR